MSLLGGGVDPHDKADGDAATKRAEEDESKLEFREHTKTR